MICVAVVLSGLELIVTTMEVGPSNKEVPTEIHPFLLWPFWWKPRLRWAKWRGKQGALMGPTGGLLYICTTKWEQGAKWKRVFWWDRGGKREQGR